LELTPGKDCLDNITRDSPRKGAKGAKGAKEEGKRERDLSPVPAAQSIRYLSRQGRKGAKYAKEKKKVIISEIIVIHQDSSCSL
jgi:hypothetical protein